MWGGDDSGRSPWGCGGTHLSGCHGSPGRSGRKETGVDQGFVLLDPVSPGGPENLS